MSLASDNCNTGEYELISFESDLLVVRSHAYWHINLNNGFKRYTMLLFCYYTNFWVHLQVKKKQVFLYQWKSLLLFVLHPFRNSLENVLSSIYFHCKFHSFLGLRCEWGIAFFFFFFLLENEDGLTFLELRPRLRHFNRITCHSISVDNFVPKSKNVHDTNLPTGIYMSSNLVLTQTVLWLKYVVVVVVSNSTNPNMNVVQMIDRTYYEKYIIEWKCNLIIFQRVDDFLCHLCEYKP